MVKSFSADSEDLVLDHYRERKLGEGHLITNDFGSWAYLTKKEYEDLKHDKIEEPLLSVLKENGLMITPDNIEREIERNRGKNCHMFQGASLHIVVVTLRCNMKCVYCHARAQPTSRQGYDMDVKTARKTVDFIFKSPSHSITIEFQGGEPLLNFDVVKDIIEYAERKKDNRDLKFTLVTNLTLMTDEILDYLILHKVGICTSIDGPEEIHNKNRGEYDKTIKWAKKIVKKTRLNAMPLVTRYSLAHPDKIVDEYFNLGVERIFIKPVNNLGFAQDVWKDIGFNADEFLDFYKKALARVVLKNKERFFPEHFSRLVLRKILTSKCVNYTDLQSPCGASRGQIAYNYDGQLFTCDEGRQYDMFNIGMLDDNYKDVVTSPEAMAVTKASINDNPYCEICAYKPYCGLCPVCHYAEFGNIIPKMPDRRCKILMGIYDHLFDKLLNDEEYRKVFYTWVKTRV